MKPERDICCKNSLSDGLDEAEQTGTDSGIVEESGYTSKIIIDDEFERSLLTLIKCMPKFNDGGEIDWTIIKLLGKYLEINDYETNLFSGWVLRTLLIYTSLVSDTMNKCDYKIFISWLFEEINLVRFNPDLAREDFFRIMNKSFHEALAEIMDGDGLSSPLKFFCKILGGEEAECSPGIAFCESHKSLEIMSYDKLNEGESVFSSLFERTNCYYESILNSIVDATYEIFGTELNYELIQLASVEQDNYKNYVLPYHYRKPKKVKKAESLIDAATGNEKNKKRKSAIKKAKNAETKLSLPEQRNASFQRHNYILPLSEAMEAGETLLNPPNEISKEEAITS